MEQRLVKQQKLRWTGAFLLLTGCGFLGARLIAAPSLFRTGSTARVAAPANFYLVEADSAARPRGGFPTPTPGGSCTTVVTNTTDIGSGSLREAITCSNLTPGKETISFNIPGTGVKTIAPTSALPSITDPVIIDGTTQGQGTATTSDDAKPNTNGPTQGTNAMLLIEIDLTGAGGIGLRIAANNSEVRGLIINRSPNQGINVGDANGNGAGTVIEGCFIGTNRTGDAAGPGNGGGIFVAADDVVIGGTTPAARNLISGNGAGISAASSTATAFATNMKVQGNLIGTNAAGSEVLSPDSTVGIYINNYGGNHIIGGDTPAERNVISGHNRGIELSGDTLGAPLGDNKIQGNYIGLNAGGTAAVANRIGVVISGTQQNNFIGGTGVDEGNVISGNSQANLQLGSFGNMVQGNSIGPNAAGTSAPTGLANGSFSVGISVDAGNNTIGGTASGAGNVIAFNPAYGVFVGGISASDINLQNVSILRNSIFSNGQIGINLLGKDGPGGVTPPNSGPFNVANRGQDYPVLTGTTGDAITATLHTEASKAYRIEFFASDAKDPTGFGEGQKFLGFVNVTTDANGDINTPTKSVTFNSPSSISGKFISATATDPAGNTSEFSGAVEAGGGACSTAVTNSNDGGPGSLRAAISCANSTPGAQTINLPAGTYKLTRAGRDEDGNATGDLDITDDLTITGAGAATTIIDADALDRAFDVISDPQTGTVNLNLLTKVTLTGLTITKGRAIGDGGGVRSNGILKLQNDKFTDNTTVRATATMTTNGRRGALASANGGGVAAVRVGSTGGVASTTLDIANCTFTSNKAAGAGGGAYGAASGDEDKLSISGSIFSNNIAGSYGGGGAANGGPLAMAGCTVSGNQSEDEGGGFACEGGAAALATCTFSNNASGAEGGGLANEGGSLSMANCTFEDNTSGDEGGGVANEGGDMAIASCNFRDNTSEEGGGGGFVNASGELVMAGCIVSGNLSTSESGDNDGGGGFENEGGSLTMSRCTITDNTVTETGGNGEGGGGFENEGGSLDMVECTVSGNTSDGPGGGIYNQGGEANLVGCTISGNTTEGDGGGINADGGDLDMTNCTISGNSAEGAGGGIGEVDGGTLLNCTIASNSAPFGGGIFQGAFGGSDLIFRNTLLAGPVGAPDKVQFSNATYGFNESGPVATITVTRIPGGTGGGGSNYAVGPEPAARVQSLGNNISSDNTLAAFLNKAGDRNNTDPKLAPLADNGGPTQTHALLAGSPAIDGGSSTGAPAKDQRGVTRPQDGDGNGIRIPDVGAFELEGSPDKRATGFVTVKYATSDGSAIAGQDYTAKSATLSFAPGDNSETFTVPINNDALVENNETVNLILSAPTGGAVLGTPAQAVLTIVDNDETAGETFQFSAASYRVNEGAGTATITITRSGGNTDKTKRGGIPVIGVHFDTSNGTATAGSDYTMRSIAVPFVGAQTSTTVTVPIINDTLDEPNETVKLTLSNPTGGVTLGTPAQAVLTIVDNDDTPTGVTDVTSIVTITRGKVFPYPYLPTVFRPATQFRQIVTLKNTSGGALNGSVSVALDNLSGGTLTNASGTTNATTPAGSPFVNVGSGNVWPAGETRTAILDFKSSSGKVSYNLRVLAGPGPR